MSVLHTISRPYAKAIFENAIQYNSIEKWKEMLILINTIAASEKIRNFLSGSLSPQYLSLVFITISGDKINQYAKNLIRLLSENQRFTILKSILEQFLQLEALYYKITIVELRSAHFLDQDEIYKIKKILEKFFLRKIKLIYNIDDQILGGVTITINDRVFDFSMRNRLKQLSNSFNF